MEVIRKYSKKREAILNVIKNTDSHPTAEWIYQKLKPEIKDLSLGTVYRNLALFVANGDIIKVASINNQERYDAKLSEHSHFICNKCSAVIDINSPESTNKIIANVSENYSFNIHSYNLNFYGECENCISK